jgi:hypothetical protein
VRRRQVAGLTAHQAHHTPAGLRAATQFLMVYASGRLSTLRQNLE